jgi:hypothetical protein
MADPQSNTHPVMSTRGPLPEPREMAAIRPLPPVTRPLRPAGPRNSSVDRHRPPPLDLSRISQS